MGDFERETGLSFEIGKPPGQPNIHFLADFLVKTSVFPPIEPAVRLLSAPEISSHSDVAMLEGEVEGEERTDLDDLTERIAFLQGKIEEKRRGRGIKRARMELRDLLAQQEALHVADLDTVPPVVISTSPVDHQKPVANRPARKPAWSPVYRFGLATMLAGAAAGAMIVPEVRADEPLPLQPISGSIGRGVRLDLAPSPDPNIYVAIPLRHEKTGPITVSWVRFPANVGDLLNGVRDAVAKFGLKVSDQCVKTIAIWNRSSLLQKSGDTSGWSMNAPAAPVKISVAPTISVNGSEMTNYCMPIGDRSKLRLQPTKTRPVVVSPPALTDPMGEDEKRKNTLLGGALTTFLLGLGGGAFWWIRRRNQMGVGQTALVPVKPIAYTYELKPSNLVPDTTRLVTPLEKAVGDEAEQILVSKIRDLNSQGEELNVHVGDLYDGIRSRIKASRPRSGPPPAKPG